MGSEAAERGTSALAARSAPVAALVGGVAALLVYNALPNTGLRFLLLLAVFVAGAAALRAAGRPFSRVADAVGFALLRGLGEAVLFLGAYLTSPLLVTLASPDRFDPGPGPSASTLVVLTYLAPTVGLLWLAAKGIRAGAVGLGLVVPSAVLTLLVLGGVGPLTVALVLLGIGIAGAAAAVASSSGAGTVGAAAAAISVAGAIGTGVAPLDALTGPDRGGTPVGGLDGGMQVVVVVVGLAIAALVGLVSVLRRDGATGVLAAAALVVPPTGLLVRTTTNGGSTTGLGWVLAAVPLVIAVVALLAVALPPARRLADRVVGWLRPGGATTVGAMVAVAGLAFVGFTTQALPLLGGSQVVSAAVALVLLTGVAVVARRLPGAPGTLLAGAVLAGFALSAPWYALTRGDVAASRDLYDGVALGAVIGSVVTAGLVWLFLRAHPHPGVAAAAAYLVLSQSATLLTALLRPADGRAEDDQGRPVVVLVLPLLVVGVAGGLVALRGRTRRVVGSGQAVLAVAVAAGGFALLTLLVVVYGRLDDEAYRPALPTGASPLSPTDVMWVSRLIRDPAENLMVGAVVLLLLGVLAMATLARRPSGALAAASTLLLVGVGQVLAGTALEAGGIDTFDGVMWVAVALTVVLLLVTAMAVRSAPAIAGTEPATPEAR